MALESSQCMFEYKKNVPYFRPTNRSQVKLINNHHSCLRTEKVAVQLRYENEIHVTIIIPLLSFFIELIVLLKIMSIKKE